jgi:signal transduction histidine kinase/CheY-like chemotaxis protein
MASLVEVKPGGGKRWNLSPLTRIGRDVDNDICLADPLVSPRHAEVRTADDGGYRLVDLGSRRGTFLASRRVTDAALQDGDEILIGVARLRFEKAAEQTVVIETGPTGTVSLGEGSALESLLKVPVAITFRPAAAIGSVDDLRRDHGKLLAAVQLTRALGVEHDPVALLGRLLDTAFQLLDAERGVAMLIDPATGQPTLQIARGRDGKPTNVVLSTSLLSEVISARAGVITSDPGSDSRFSRAASLFNQGIRSAMCVPLLYQDEILGIVHVDSRGTAGAFTPKDLELFSVIASQAALAVKNALLVGMMRTQAAAEKTRLERIVKNLPSGVLLLDGERRIIALNEQAAELLPAVTESRMGDELELLGNLTLDEVLAYRGRTPLLVNRSKRIFTVVATSAGAETVVVLHDVTLERAEEARESQKERMALIGQLAGGIAHDFNNLLAVILNYARFAEPEIQDAEVREDVRQIRLAAQRATELTRQLLAFSRREVIHPRIIEPNKLVGDMEKLVRRTLGEHIGLATHFGDGLPAVRVDPSKLEQVVLNLVVNARDAMPEGGTLRLATADITLDAADAEQESLPPGRYVAISIADTGCGMPPEVAARVFEPFFTTKEKGKGTGLGLATVYGIVKQAGGGIALHTEAGVGTVFRVLLPVTDEEPQVDEAQVAPAGGRETVLIAEDEPAVREITRRILAQAGYEVLIAGSGDEALAAATAHQGPIQLLLTDLVMPGMSGKQLAERFRKERAEGSVLYMSGYFDDEVIGKGVLDAGVAFLPKPFSRDELLHRVRQVLGA